MHRCVLHKTIRPKASLSLFTVYIYKYIGTSRSPLPPTTMTFALRDYSISRDYNSPRHALHAKNKNILCNTNFHFIFLQKRLLKSSIWNGKQDSNSLFNRINSRANIRKETSSHLFQVCVRTKYLRGA